MRRTVRAAAVVACLLGVLGGIAVVAPPAGASGLPVVSAVTPDGGPPAGGQTVAVTGSGFTGATAVTFGSAPAASFQVVSDTSLTAVVPAASGDATVGVTVTTAAGSSAATAGDQYVYEGAPTVVGISPDGGPTAGGGQLSIEGMNFTGATAVDFGSVPGSAIDVVQPGLLTVTTPAGAAGTTVDVRVTTPAGTSPVSTADEFTFTQPPTVTSFTPTAGAPDSTTPLTITGTNLASTYAVDFSSSPTQVRTVAPVSASPTTVVVYAPDDPTLGLPLSVSLLAAGGEASVGLYYESQYIWSVTPSAGLPAGGTEVTLTGGGLSGATSVDFGSTPGTLVSDNGSVVAIAPPGTGSVPVTVTTPGGVLSTLGDGFTYEPVPVVTGISPTTGPSSGGTSVTITGQYLNEMTAVYFGNLLATATSVSPSSIVAVAPAGAGTVDVTVGSAVGRSATSPADQFSYIPAPAVTSLSPPAGPDGGDNPVTISGTNLAGVTAVQFGALPATGFTVNSPTSLTAVPPAGADGTAATVRLTGPGGTSAATGAQYIYESTPVVTGLSASYGLPGSDLTLTGTDLADATTVDVGSVPALITGSFLNSVEIEVPGGQAGTVPVTVTTPVGTSTPTTATSFTVEAAPTVTGVSPPYASPGSTVQLTGTSLGGVAVVQFGTTVTTQITRQGNTSATVVVPPGSGAVTVTASDSEGTGGGATFWYGPGPEVTSVGPVGGTVGTAVTISGYGFTGATAVQFGGVAATTFSVASDSTVTAVVPEAGLGWVDVTVTTPAGTSPLTADDQFDDPVPPVVRSAKDNKGPWEGGTSVVLTGTFPPDPTVTFAGVAGTVTSSSASSITVTSPPGSAGVASIIVAGPYAASSPTAAARFTYQGPTVSAVSPTSGPGLGGAAVHVTGTNLAGVTGVLFGSSPATSVTVLSPTSLSAAAPAGSGTVKLSLVYEGGTVAPGTRTYKYLPPPAVTSVSPSSGPLAGGTRVTIHGTGLAGATAVDVGGLAATVISNSSSALVVLTPPGAAAGEVAVTVTNADGTSNVTGESEFTYL